MPYKDLREFISQVDEIGELTRLEGVDWNEEVGAVSFMTSNAVLMDNFPGYPPGYRVFVNGGSLRRSFLAANWSTKSRGLELTKAWKEHMREFKPVPPKWVKDGPIMENISTGEDINVLKFPAPKWHEEDGGRYIGTGGISILKDPETGRLNIGVYRMQVHDKATLGIPIMAGKDGYIIREKYWRQGKPCPVVSVFGVDPALFMTGGQFMVHVNEASEFDLVGWLKGMPEEVIRGQFTGLPIPANAEIAIEGEMVPGDVVIEGPYGEGTGYSEPRLFPVVRVKWLYHRNAPILIGSMSRYHPPGRGELGQDFHTSALIWDQLEKAGVREIKGVACYFQHALIVVSIRNSYAGHSQQAGLIASQCHSGAYGNSWVIVVDEDIDPTILGDVIWAATNRVEAKRSIQVLDYLWSSFRSNRRSPQPHMMAEYPLIPSKATYGAAVVIDACVPVEWEPSWHRIVRPSQELQARILKKWGKELKLKEIRHA